MKQWAISGAIVALLLLLFTLAGVEQETMEKCLERHSVETCKNSLR